MAHKIEFRADSQTYVAAVEKSTYGPYYLVFLEDDSVAYHVSYDGKVSRFGQTLKRGSAPLLCRTAVELAKEFLEERTGE